MSSFTASWASQAGAFFIGCAFMSWLLLISRIGPLIRLTARQAKLVRLHGDVAAALLQAMATTNRMRACEQCSARMPKESLVALDDALTRVRLELRLIEREMGADMHGDAP